MNFYNKSFVVFLFFFGTYIYSSFQKNISEEPKNSDIILKVIPSFSAKKFLTKAEVSNSIILSGEKTYIHFWGTWCAPCVDEIPDLLAFAETKGQNKNIFLLIYVNDDEKKVSIFLSKLGKIPSNVIIASDSNGSIMNSFGTIKVPETYIVDFSGNILKKYIGPQVW